MKFVSLLYVVLFFSSECIFAQEKTDVNKEAAYTQTINSRAQKIVATIGIKDSVKFYRVQQIVAAQYRNLNDLHSSRDAKMEIVKASGGSKETADASMKSIQDEAATKIDALHKDYLKQLASELSDEQVAKVKDGMTYNVVNITYRGYLDMLPNLTTEQKTQIKAWLIEAREHAMDAETSDKKHAWFGKYKGRINNYLSSAGYDLKKEGEAWQKRIKEREEEKKNSTKN